MLAVKRSVKKLMRFLRILAWNLGGQKEHQETGFRIPVGAFISHKSKMIFSQNLILGADTQIMEGSIIICAGMPPYVEASGTIFVGDRTIIREYAMLQTYGGAITVGSDCTINPFCVLQGNGGIEIGDNVLIAANVSMFSANHVFTDPDRPIRTQGETRIGIKIGSNVWIGAGCIILDGVSVGDGAVIAAGAVVNRDVAAGSLVAGVPGRLVGAREKTR
mgnify:CR=1 FL=1|jgi:acetyltransferase-like isoleucine patch superfamily enzyme